jgi:hypothetical protein
MYEKGLHNTGTVVFENSHLFDRYKEHGVRRCVFHYLAPPTATVDHPVDSASHNNLFKDDLAASAHQQSYMLESV